MASHDLSARCRDRFASDPSKYSIEKHEPPVVRPNTPSTHASSPPGYTCPMHPEVRADQRLSARVRTIFAFFYNAAGIPIAAGVLYPFLGLLLSPMIAAAVMSFSSGSVIGNARRLRRANV